MRLCSSLENTCQCGAFKAERAFAGPVSKFVNAARAMAVVVVAGALCKADVTLTWDDNSSNESGFRIERSTDGSVFSLVGTVGEGVTAYSDSATLPSTTYWYRVNAYNSYGTSGYTNVVSHTTDAEVNTPPTISSVSNQSINSGSGVSNSVSFTIGDAETASTQLLTTATSSNGSLIPSQNINLSGSGSSRSVTVAPIDGLSGDSTITIYVTDGVNTVSETYLVTVLPVANIALSDPLNGSTYHLGDSLSIDLTVFGSVSPTSVSYYVNDVLLDVVEDAPFTSNVGIPETGTLAFHVVAQMSDGSELVSQAVEIEVQGITAPTNLEVSQL